MALRFTSLWRRAIALLIVFAISAWFGREAFLVEPDSLIVAEYALELPSWPAALNGFRIAAVGDIHAGSPFIDEGKLEEVTRRISAARPDLIVWLGDYVIQGVKGGHFMEPEKVAAILSKAKATHGQVAIIGNHDRWLDSFRIETAFVAAGIPFLRWSSRTIEANGERVHVYGLDDFDLAPDYWSTFKAARKQWAALPPGEPLIILSHNPDVFPSLPARATLTLAAHTHGGQVRLPLIGSPIVPSSFGQRFARGPIVEGGRHLFVNTGIGTSIIPIRFGVSGDLDSYLERPFRPLRSGPTTVKP